MPTYASWSWAFWRAVQRWSKTGGDTKKRKEVGARLELQFRRQR